MRVVVAVDDTGVIANTGQIISQWRQKPAITPPMPIVRDIAHPVNWIEPDAVPRPVVTYGFVTSEFANVELDFHNHAKGQIMLVLRGALSCEVEGGLWIVPPRSAIWVPGGADHAVRVSGTLKGYNAFVDAAMGEPLPKTCCAVSVTPLLRELLARAATLPVLYQETQVNTRLLGVLIDELAAAPVDQFHLPMPRDLRLRAMVDAMLVEPAQRGTLNHWARHAGMSERTLERRMSEETGMSFGRWRQRLAVVLAVQWLADGRSIQSVAYDLGYNSAAAFVTMFRKMVGASPARYMAERYHRA